MAETRTPIISFKNFSFQYRAQKQPTLHDINLDIYPGERVLIAGPSGSGKSTLAACINGLNPFSYPGKCTGTLTVDGVDAPHSSIFELAGHVGTVLQDPDGQFIGLTVGEDIAFALENSCTPQDEMHEITRRARHIGYVMQNPNQMISKTMIFDEVALGLQGSGLTDAEIRARVEDTLKVCGLYPFRNWPISALSFGQKKRVTIASVLVQDPELIILDEPTAGQDFRHYTDIMEFLRGLNAKGVTVVMITHDMHLMLEYTPRALAFCDGRLIADRSAAAILCDPALIEQAALKETSLYTLANRCGITPAEKFVERFIAADREVRADGC